MAITLTSSAFSQDGAIPELYTCKGADVSPPLSWMGVPAGTESFALIVDDPDAPGKTWVHWVVYNIPAEVTFLPESGSRTLPDGAMEGLNDWGKTGYRGPCPPSGTHRYQFKLFALDTILPEMHNPSKKELLNAIDSHKLAETQLVGTFSK